MIYLADGSKLVCGHCGGRVWGNPLACHNYACWPTRNAKREQIIVISPPPKPRSSGKKRKESMSNIYNARVENDEAKRRIQSACNYCDNRLGACLTGDAALECDHRMKQLAEKVFSNAAVQPAETVEAILDQRGSRYGSFADNARISQRLYDVLMEEHAARIARGNAPLQYHHKEALKQICTKMCRIISGDPNYADNWDDIAGYAQLGKHPR